MSAFSASSSSSTSSTKGFSQKDVQQFLGRGASLASKRADQPGISSFKPKERTLTETQTQTQSAGSVAQAFGASDQGTGSTSKTFGIDSGFDKGQLDLISSSFLRRSADIKQRRSQPGRTGLFFGRS